MRPTLSHRSGNLKVSWLRPERLPHDGNAPANRSTDRQAVEMSNSRCYEPVESFNLTGQHPVRGNTQPPSRGPLRQASLEYGRHGS